MTRRRALTLLEVLAAIVLLTSLALAWLPILHRSARLGQHGAPLTSATKLAEFADAFLNDPGAFGISDLDAIVETTLLWRSNEVAPETVAMTIEIARVEFGGDNAPGDIWFIFRMGDHVVLRWMAKTDSEEVP